MPCQVASGWSQGRTTRTLLNTSVSAPGPSTHPLLGTGSSARRFSAMPSDLPPYSIRVRRCTIHAGRFRWDILDGTRPIASAPESFATRDQAKAAGVKEVDRLTGGGEAWDQKNAQRAALSHRGGHPSEHRAALAPAPRRPFLRPKRVRSYRNKSNSEKSPRARTTRVKNQVVPLFSPHPAPVFWRASPRRRRRFYGGGDGQRCGA